MRKYILPLLAPILISPASAAVEQIRVLDQTGYMPSGLFMFMLAVMFISLVVSYRYNDEMAGFVSLGAGFICVWTSRAVDYITGISYTSTTTTVVHTIYRPDILTVFSGICFVLALLNLYRVYVLSKATGQVG